MAVPAVENEMGVNYNKEHGAHYAENHGRVVLYDSESKLLAYNQSDCQQETHNYERSSQVLHELTLRPSQKYAS